MRRCHYNKTMVDGRFVCRKWLSKPLILGAYHSDWDLCGIQTATKDSQQLQFSCDSVQHLHNWLEESAFRTRKSWLDQWWPVRTPGHRQQLTTPEGASKKMEEWFIFNDCFFLNYMLMAIMICEVHVSVLAHEVWWLQKSWWLLMINWKWFLNVIATDATLQQHFGCSWITSPSKSEHSSQDLRRNSEIHDRISSRWNNQQDEITTMMITHH